MNDDGAPRPGLSRRTVLAAGGIAAVPIAAGAAAPAAPQGLDPPALELVLNILVTCSRAEPLGPATQAPDGDRSAVWPIVGGRFWGDRVKGSVVPGGADYPVRRPDGVTVVDALYRLRAEDGTIIVIHNRGLRYPDVAGTPHYRLSPSFTTVQGPHDWLTRSLFVATLVPGRLLPPELKMAVGENQNDRLIQVYRIG